MSPLKKGKSKKVVKQNFEEFGKGKTYARTKAKSGKKKAEKQRIAVVLKTKRASTKKKAKR